MDDIGIPRINVQDYAEFSTAMDEVLKQDHDRRSLIIDTADWLDQMIAADVCERGGRTSIADFEWGKGSAEVAARWQWVVSALQALFLHRRMAIVIVAHSRIEKFTSPDGPSYDRWVPDLSDGTKNQPGARSLLVEWADEVFFCKYREFTASVDQKGKQGRTIGVGSGDRIAFTSERPSHVAKRHIDMPDEIEFPRTNGFAAYYHFWPKSEPPIVQAAPQTDESTDTPPTAVVAGNISGIVADGHSSKKKESAAA